MSEVSQFWTGRAYVWIVPIIEGNESMDLYFDSKADASLYIKTLQAVEAAQQEAIPLSEEVLDDLAFAEGDRPRPVVTSRCADCGLGTIVAG
jgi:hypothetical protein